MNHLLQKLFNTKHILIHTLLIIFIWLWVFGVIQKISAQEWDEWFSVINTQFPATNKNIGNYITTWNFGNIILWASWSIDNEFIRYRSWISTRLYRPYEANDPFSNTIYFNNFDDSQSTDDNAIPLADSIRDFTWWTSWTWQNWWRYLYAENTWPQTETTTWCYDFQLWWQICDSCDINLLLLPWQDNTCEPNMLYPWETYTGIDTVYVVDFCDYDDWMVCPWDPYICYWDQYGITYSCPLWRSCDVDQFYCTWEAIAGDWQNLTDLTFSGENNIRQIWTDPISTYNFANIGKYYAHPWSWNWMENIPVIRERTSNLTWRIKIINTLDDDIYNCGSWIIYKIYTGNISSTWLLSQVNTIETRILNNWFSWVTIEEEIDIINWQKIFFEIDNRWDNQCDGTWNHIQIHDITDWEEAQLPPTFTEDGKYWWAIEFDWSQSYSLWTWINQKSGITISAWIKTNDNTQPQWIITKQNSYWIILKDWMFYVSPSTYWFWHNTNIPLENWVWTHIAWTYDWQTMNFYKNWWPSNPDWSWRTYNIVWQLEPNENLAYIWLDEINSRWRNWAIDEVRMYNTWFTAQQIQQLYESNLKIVEWDTEDNSYREFTSNKTWLADWTYYYTWTSDSLNKTGRITVDISWPTVDVDWTGNNESNDLSIDINAEDANWVSWYQRRRYLDGQRTNRSNWTMNSEFTIPAKDEPTTGLLEINVKDSVWRVTNRSWTIEWVNIWPIVETLSWNTYITWYIEDKLTFFVIATDTGNNDISYQWYIEVEEEDDDEQQPEERTFYNFGKVFAQTKNRNIIPWATWFSYTTGRNQASTWKFQIIVKDSQWAERIMVFSGEWFDVEEWDIPDFWNTWTDLEWSNTETINIWWPIIQQWTIGFCTSWTSSTSYLWTDIGNDYCIINSWWTQQIVLGRYWVNRYNTLFTLTGKKENPYLINTIDDPFVLQFQNTNLTWFSRTISWTNNTNTWTFNIFDDNLIWLYNFDKIIIADSESDFMPIQSGKNRSYLRRPRGETTYTWLQYDILHKKRVIGTGEDLFIDNKLINPGDLYGDAVIWRTSPINSTVLVEYSFELDPNSNQSCIGNWITYKFKLNAWTIHTWEILELWTVISDNKIIEIKEWDSIYFEINSKQNDFCDVAIYDIKVYQLPESNLIQKSQYRWTNIWANYFENGRYWWALDFFGDNPQGQYVSIWTGIFAPKMSISLRAYKIWDNSPQTIIEKRWSYWLIISGNKLHVVDNYTLINTQIEIPNYTRTHIGRNHKWESADIYINGKLATTIYTVSNLAPNSLSTQIWYIFPHGQRLGLLDEIYIYSWNISSWHFATLYEHNLNKIAWDRWKWTSNQVWWVNDGKYYFTWSTNWNSTQIWEIRRDFTAPEFSWRSWIMSGSQLTWFSNTGIFVLWQEDVILSGILLTGVWKWINTWTYIWNLDDDGSIESTWDTIYINYDWTSSHIIRLSVEDLAWNILNITGNIIWTDINWPVFSWWEWTTWFEWDSLTVIWTFNPSEPEDENITISSTWYDRDLDDDGEFDILNTWNNIEITFPTWAIIPNSSGILEKTIKIRATNNLSFKKIESVTLQRENVGWPIFSGFFDGNIKTGLILNESEDITIQRTWIDQNDLYTTGFSRTIRIPWTWDFILTWETEINIPAQDEPIMWEIEIIAEDIWWYQTISVWIIQWTNAWPVLTNQTTEYPWLVEKPITFIITWFTDTGNNLWDFTYQRYSWHTCISWNAITWETNNTYTKTYDTVYTWNFSYQIFDKQLSWTCHDFVGIRETFTEWIPPIINIWNSWTDLEWSDTGIIDIWWSVAQQWTIGICTWLDTSTNYWSTDIWNDYCIIQTWWNQIVLWWYGVNRYNTLFNLTGTIKNPEDTYYILSSKTNPFETKIQNTHLTWFKRAISGTNNNTIWTYNIFDDSLLGLYNFDEILLADSLEDFTPIQKGKNRSYFRRQLWWNNYTWLQYHPESKQRIISNPIQEFDWLFISNNKINPGYWYWDAVLGRTSPISTDIKIELSLIDDNSTCGDGLTYKLFNQNTEISSGTYGNHIINTSIAKNDNLYFRINSNLDNDCDTTNYRIKIYQRPETNIANNVRITPTFGINSWANYIQTGKFWWAIEFTENNKFINLGTWLHNTWAMSISMRVYKKSDQANQTILIKTGSYGIAIFNNTLQVTNKTTQQRFDTQIEIPNDTWTHIWRSYNWSTIYIYINGKLEKIQWLQWSISQSSNPTYLWYSPSNGQRNGMIDELYIYSWAISSWHFATLYEHNLNRITWNKWNWTSNTSWSINEGNFNFTITSTSQNWTTNTTWWEIRKDFNGPLFSWRSWEANWTNDSTTWNIIEIAWKHSITLSWIRDDNFWLWINTWSYQRDIDNDWTIDNNQETIEIQYQNAVESRIIKAIVEDEIGNISTITWEIKRLNANPPTFSWFLWTTGFESLPITVSRTGILPDPLSTKIDWTITLPSSTITHENTGTTITIPAEDEPTIANISVKITDEYGFEMTNPWTIEWINKWPIITDTITEYSWVVEKLLVFNAVWLDTWSQLTYQRYSTWWCPINQTIAWEISENYSTKRDVPTTWYFSYQIFDNQWSWSCHNFVAIRSDQVLNTWSTIYTTWIDVQWSNTGQIAITGTIIDYWTKWICATNEEYKTYTANPQTIWNDYCIIQTWSDVNSRVVLWFNNININKTFFSITGSLFQQQRLLSPTSNLFNINIITNNLTWLTQTISGTNNSKTISGNIYTGLLAMYNFDKILLTDSQTDFGPIQNYKWRSYQRRPRGTWNFTDLQYDPVSQQRLVSTPIQEYDGMFIKSNTLNPGDDYGDIILKRTSPFHSNIEINLNLSDAIASCGDGIKYEIVKWTQNIYSWSYGNQTIQTTISKSESLYFKINSSWNNLCDTTNYRIQIYQLPETNISQNKTFAINSWAQYITEGKKWWAFQFTNNNQTVLLGTWLINTSAMSIAFRINPENTNWNQTIIQKWSSYGIALSSWIIYVTNKSTQQRFNTEVEIETNKRTHIWRSYDWLNMKLYKNWQNIRSKYINWSIWLSTDNTIIGYSIEHGQFIGKIDEIYIYNYVLPQNIITLLHQYNVNKTWPYNRSLTENKDAFTNWTYDWKYNQNIIVSNTTWFNTIIDFNWPIIKEINWLTGRESKNLTITWILYDSWSQFSGYQRRTIINQTTTNRSQRNNSSNFTITIPSQIESSTGHLEIKTRDIFWHELISTNNISWQNTGPIISNNQVYEYIAEIWSNITFAANAIDEWSNLTYQRYSWHDCNEILITETNSTLTIGNNTAAIGIYSFKVFDNYQEPSICVNLTWTWQNQIGFQNLTVYLTWDWKWWNITGNRNSLNWLWAWYSQTGDEIIVNGQKWICTLTGNKTEIIYTRKEERQWNDSCILKLDNNEYILLAFIDIHTWFLATRTQPFPEITSDKDFINLYSTIYIPEITNFIINRGWETTQWSWLINKTTTWQDNTLIRKYSFDRILITDSTQDFSKFEDEYNWQYFRDNWTTTWNFVFNPRTQSRIINEPLQDYEYIFINSWQSYPWSNKYGNLIYQRVSNISWNIDIENKIENANPWYCTTTDGIIYTIKKWNSYETSNTIYTKDLSDLTENTTTETTINSGEKIYFVIDSKNNNQCDKISFNTKVFFNPIHDFSASWQALQTSWVIYNPTWKFWWAYDFNASTWFLNIGTINKSTWLTFSTRIKINSTINSTENQTIIYKEWSYWLTIKDWSLKITTDEWRRHNTNTYTTSILTNWQRNHLLRTYDGADMYIYVNWEQTRTNRIVWYYPTNSNSTIIWRSNDHGQLNWSIDELQVRNKFIPSNKVSDIYNINFRKINWTQRDLNFSQTWLADGIYTLTWIVNWNNIFTWTIIIDNNAPIIEFTDYTWNESEDLYISLTGYDESTSISWFVYRYKKPNTASWSDRSTTRSRQSSWNEIIIETENEPTTWTLEVKIRDQSNNNKTYTQTIERLNLPIITEPLLVTGYEWSTITFTASWYDPGGTTNTWYQRYLSSNCWSWTTITWAIWKTFTTGRNEASIIGFSYKIKDAQNLRSECTAATGNRLNIIPIAKDIYINASWNVYITFNATWSDPGNTNFTYQRYSWTWCTNEIVNQTGQSFTTWSEKSGTREFSYHIRDANWATWVNNINTWRECQIATWIRPFINPVANNFDISTNTSNKLVTWDRRDASNAKDPEFDTTITAVISSWSKWYCQITNNRISFQPIVNNIWTWFCELTLTDGNYRSTTIKAYALNIDTTAPTTTITTWDYKSFELLYQDTSITTAYYKILTWVWNTSSCWTSWYTTYVSWSTINIIYTPSTTDYRTICYYSEDIHGNRENTKTQLFTQPRDAVPFNVIFSSNPFMNTLFEATITTNKACTGTLTWLNWTKTLSLSEWTNTITGNFTENNWQKTAYINLQTQNTGEIFTHTHTFIIDQTPPSIPIITEQIENNDYYIIKRSPSTDDVSGIKWYNYEINNQYTKVKEWFTDVTYLNIPKSEVQYNSWISIKVQSQDNVDNLSQRSSIVSITIPQQVQTTTIIDTTPNQFSFTKTTNAKRNTIYTSNEIVIWWLSNNTSIPISLSTWSLFINDTKITSNSGLVKNWDIVYIQLHSSNSYNESNHTILIANWVSATYTITTESSKPNSSTSFLDELRKLLEQLQEEDTTTKPITTDVTIDTTRVSAPHIAPNGKEYKLYKTIDWRYSSHNFIIKKYFTSLSEMKSYIDKNNPK